jgi:hypothetical protein
MRRHDFYEANVAKKLGLEQEKRKKDYPLCVTKLLP